jgi:hypothetical protein
MAGLNWRNPSAIARAMSPSLCIPSAAGAVCVLLADISVKIVQV